MVSGLKTLHRIILSLVTVVLLSGCTTTQTDPAKVSWGDLVEGDRLELHLAQRRADLRELQRQSAVLQSEVNGLKEKLASAEQDLVSATDTLVALKTDQEGLELAVANARARLGLLLEEISRIRNELILTKIDLKSSRKSLWEIRKKEIEFARLEKDKENLTNLIEGIIRIRDRYAIETQ